MTGRQKKYAEGTRHKTNNFGEIEIIECVDALHRRVRFVNTGTIKTTRTTQIHSGEVRDPFAPTVHGIGFLGHDPEFEHHPMRYMLFIRWRNMLDRVYNIKNGKTLDPSWHDFSVFMRDVLSLKGVELLQVHSKTNRIDLDGDIIPQEIGIPSRYSKETSQWVTRAVNLRACKHPETHNIRPLGSIIETRHGPVTLIGKDDRKWLIRFSDGVECWRGCESVLRDTFGKPKTTEVV